MINTTYSTNIYGAASQSNNEYNLLVSQHNMIFLNVEGNQMGCFSETTYQSSLSTFPFAPDSISNTDIVVSDVGTIGNYYPTTHFFVGTVSLEQTCAELSVTEDLKTTLSVFPNPTSTGETVTVRFENNHASKIELITVSGSIVESLLLSSVTNEVQLSSLQQAGMYFVQLLDASGNIIAIEKLMIE